MGVALVPELSVSDIGRSLAFYRDILGFSVRYARPEEGFVYLEMGQAALMLDQLGAGRDWVTGALEPPFGRGVNFQIVVESLQPLLNGLAAHGVELFQPQETRSYRSGDDRITQRQFCVGDPDGYLLRFCEIV